MYNKKNKNTHTACCRIVWPQWWSFEDKAQKSVLKKYNFDLTFNDFQMSHQKLDIILENKVIQISKNIKMSILKNLLLNRYVIKRKKIRMIWWFLTLKIDFECQIYALFESTKNLFNWGGIKPRRTPDKEVRPNPLVLAWVTNVSTSPDLYIEFSTEY